MPFSDTSFYDVAVQCLKRSPRWRPHLLRNLYFLNLGLYVYDILENCTIFGTTIFLDWRENAPIGENGFWTYSKNYSVIFSILFEIFKH